MARRLPECLLVVALLLAAACTEANHQPSIDPIAPKEVHIGQVLRIVVRAWDPDGDALEITATPMPETAAWETDDEGHPVFVWAPLVSETSATGIEYVIHFVADDGRGGKAVRQVTVRVLPKAGQGAPVFIGPPGYVLNLSQDDDIAFVVSVKDDDSPSVDLVLVEGIEGAKFQKLTSKSASFYWKPDGEQKKQGNYWRLVVGANDGSHPQVHAEYSILLMNSDAAKDCPGGPPVLSHAQLEDQESGAIVFKVGVSDRESALREVVVHFATNNPLDPASYENHTLELERCSPETDSTCPEDAEDRHYIGVMASPAAGGTEPMLFYYYVTGTDNDDAKGSLCDHATRLPKAGHFTAALYPKTWAGDCKDDAFEPNDHVQEAGKLGPGVTYDLRSCVGPGAPDFYRLDVTAGSGLAVELIHEPEQGQLGLSLVDASGERLYPPAGSPPADHLVYTPETTPIYLAVAIPEGAKGKDHGYGLVVTRSPGTCPNDADEPNDGPEEAPLVSSGARAVTVCPGDRDWLKVSATASQTVHLVLGFQHAYGDLDLRLYDSDGATLLAVSETDTSIEEVFHTSSKEDTYFVEVRGYHGAHNSGLLLLDVVPTATLCVADRFAPNHTPGQAVLLPENRYDNLFACSGSHRTDWFRIDVNAGEQLTVLAIPEYVGAGELTVGVFSDDLGKVSIGKAEKGPEEDIPMWVATRSEAGPLRMQVGTPGQITVPYSLWFGVKDAPGECADDRFSPTNTVKSALKVPKELGLVTRLKICPGGEDWFRIEGAAMETFWAFVFGFTDEAPLSAELYHYEGETLTKLLDGESTTDGVILEYMPEQNEDLYIHVLGQPGQIHHYDLVLGVQ